MGCDIREKWIFIPFIIVYFQYFIVRINSEGMCYQEGCSTNCCNCTLESENGKPTVLTHQQGCNGTCPVGFYLPNYILSEANCVCMYSTTTVGTTDDDMNVTSFETSTATTDTNFTTITTMLISTSARLERPFICLKCDETCESCEGSATNCTKCQKEYVFNEGGNCSKIAAAVNKQPLATIIGASVGGGLALIILAVIIVCLVRRRKGRNATRMSGILQERTEGGVKPDDDVTNSPSTHPIRDNNSTHPIYENVERQGELVNQIPEQGDIILRYARDPTTIDKKKKPKQTDPSRSSSYYQNSATIRRQDNIQDVNVVPGEHEELKQLGQAPLPPTAKKTSLKNRVSKKLKKLRGNAPPKAPPISNQETQEEHYLPMGSPESSQDSQEVYEEMEDKLQQNSPTLFAQENYENVEDTLADVPSVAAPPPPPLDLEDYENIKDRFPVPERARTGQKSNSRVPDPPMGANVSKKSPRSKDDKLSKEYINVETYQQSGAESSTTDDLTSQETKEDLEDYENVKYFSKRK
ncbi:hypothetical protein ACJMK2_000537 [Sinanodonta woodiana]|uniref:Uncharacterized protein n=1 Tax=Sinanodonta woodiana TaxID=1069815 RepID=A0ABD3XSW1_SINWO